MNPLVRVAAVALPAADASAAATEDPALPPWARLPPSFLAGYHVVVLGASPACAGAAALAAACRAARVKFYAADAGAAYGAFFADLGDTHTYVPAVRTRPCCAGRRGGGARADTSRV